jgi:heme-degrading monooxygenase HmoA
MGINRVATRSIAHALGRMALDRRLLSGTPGLTFFKLLGTGRGRSFSPRDADLTTWALFAVWENADAWASFNSTSKYARIWGALSEEQWSTRLEPVKWRGTWARQLPFGSPLIGPLNRNAAPVVSGGPDEAGGPVDAGEGLLIGGSGPMAVLTRARVRPSQWRTFARSVPPVAAAVNTTAGLRYTVGIGEAPIGLQATFSLWDSESAMAEFAYGSEAHRDVMRRTNALGWYAEEMFARFRVVESSGSINGKAI